MLYKPGVRSARSLQASFNLCWRCRRAISSRSTIEEDDIVLLRRKNDASATPILTKPLRSDGKINTPKGTINQASIIGKGIRDVVSSSKGLEYRLHQPTLAEYVTLSPRLVTPIYPADANLIVSLLDLHPPVYDPAAEPAQPLEIFEAGTGHGALTLHLARAIHGANPPRWRDRQAPADPRDEAEGIRDGTSFLGPMMQRLMAQIMNNPEEQRHKSCSRNRQAVVHTLDISAKHSAHAQNVVKQFRHGIYYNDVDFHVGTIPEYLSERLLQSNQEPFLQHAILDLPSVHTVLEVVGKALKPNGSVIAFCPSITQINACVQKIKDQKLPFVLETVIEIGQGAGVGGREWDVRAVKPRAIIKAEAEARKQMEGEEVEEAGVTEQEEPLPTTSEADSGWEMVCRPKVGGRVIGGGFLGLWRRMHYAS